VADPDPIAVQARITGRVQGVWFRGWTREQARRLDLGGWVRNQPDGSVAALFVGPEAAVTEMLELCSQGPRSARVAGVAIRPVAPVPILAGFSVER